MSAILDAVTRIETAVGNFKTGNEAEIADLKAKLAQAEADRDAARAEAADNPAAVARLDAVTASVTPTA